MFFDQRQTSVLMKTDTEKKAFQPFTNVVNFFNRVLNLFSSLADSPKLFPQFLKNVQN